MRKSFRIGALLLLFATVSSFIFAQGSGDSPEVRTINFDLNDDFFSEIVNVSISQDNIYYSGSDGAAVLISTPVEILLEDINPFLSTGILIETQAEFSKFIKLSIRFRSGEGTTINWSDWMQVGWDEHLNDGENKLCSELVFSSKDVNKIIFKLEMSGADPISIDDFAIRFYNPKKTDLINLVGTENRNEKNMDCECPQPNYYTREDWCPSDDCPPNSDPTYTAAKHLIIHHSAGSNSSSDWPAVVRSIWDFHVNGRGWADIGYNWLIDPEGRIYEGRGDGIQGAHFCGHNSNTVGICIIGDYTNSHPKQDAISSLTDIYSWKACDADLDPLGMDFHNTLGTDIPNISGHRDGCNTACPGDRFYPMIDLVRTEIKHRIETECQEPIMPDIDFTAKNLAYRNVKLSWEVTGDHDCSGFRIESSPNDREHFTVLAEVDGDTYTFTDNQAYPNHLYYYRLTPLHPNPSIEFEPEEVMIITLGQIINNEIRFYPSLATNHLNLEIEDEYIGTYDLEIFDYLGKRLFAERISKAETIEYKRFDISTFSAGTYYLRITRDEASNLYPFQKQ